MVPFRVFDRDRKEMWIVLNYHPGSSGGHYLLAKEDDGDDDGVMRQVTAEEFTRMRLVDFLGDEDDFRE